MNLENSDDEKELPATAKVWRVVGELLRESGEWTRERSIPMTQSQAATAAEDWRKVPHACRNVHVEGDRAEYERLKEARAL